MLTKRIKVDLMVGSWNHNFITKSLIGVVGGVLAFPLIKYEVFKDSTDTETHFYLPQR